MVQTKSLSRNHSSDSVKHPGELHHVAQIRRLKEEGILAPKLMRQLSQAQAHAIAAMSADKT